jgi:hypothetical protein
MVGDRWSIIYVRRNCLPRCYKSVKSVKLLEKISGHGVDWTKKEWFILSDKNSNLECEVCH